MFDQVRVFFDDGSETVIFVEEEEDKASLRKELTKPYNPKKPLTLTLTTDKENAAKAG